MPISTDHLNNQAIKPAIQLAFGVVDTIQAAHPHVQAVAAAILFSEVCLAHKVSQSEIMVVADNIIAQAIRQDDQGEFRALRLYAQNELRS